jgi:hypothetical protein
MDLDLLEERNPKIVLALKSSKNVDLDLRNVLLLDNQSTLQVMNIPTLLGSDFGVLGHMLILYDAITSWLRLTATSNPLPIAEYQPPRSA